MRYPVHFSFGRTGRERNGCGDVTSGKCRPHFGRSKFGELPLKADQFATATLRSFVDLQSLVRSNAMLVRDLMSALEADHIESFVVFDTIAAGLGKHGLTET